MSTTEKIKKLLEKSRDAGASEAEAEACARKARELMEEHGLTEESLRERAQKPEVLRFPAKYQDPWRKKLGVAVGYLCGCVLSWRRDGTFAYTGSATGVVVAHGTYSRLELIVRQLASAHRSAVRGTRADQLSFERACGLRLAVRCVQMRDARDAAPEASSSGALVIASEYRRVEDWMSENTSVKSAEIRPVTIEGESGLAGWRAGGEVAMGGELG